MGIKCSIAPFQKAYCTGLILNGIKIQIKKRKLSISKIKKPDIISNTMKTGLRKLKHNLKRGISKGKKSGFIKKAVSKRRLNLLMGKKTEFTEHGLQILIFHFHAIYGSSYFVDPRGEILVKGSEDKDEVVIADLDLEQIREVRDGWQFFRDLRPDQYTDLTRTVG